MPADTQQTTPEAAVRWAFRNARLLISAGLGYWSIQADTTRGRIWLGSGSDEPTAWRVALSWLAEQGYPVEAAHG